MNFAEVLKTLRKEKGISQQELANATGIKQSSIGMYEIGARMPSYEALNALADYFNVDVSTLLGRKQMRTTDVKNFAEWMCSQLTDAGKEKLERYLMMLATDPDNIDPNKFVKDVFIDNLSTEAKTKRKEVAEQLRILKNQERAAAREAKTKK